MTMMTYKPFHIVEWMIHGTYIFIFDGSIWWKRNEIHFSRTIIKPYDFIIQRHEPNNNKTRTTTKTAAAWCRQKLFGDRNRMETMATKKYGIQTKLFFFFYFKKFQVNKTIGVTIDEWNLLWPKTNFRMKCAHVNYNEWVCLFIYYDCLFFYITHNSNSAHVVSRSFGWSVFVRLTKRERKPKLLELK